MVVLVRCNDDTCSVALESCLDGLIKGGLISAYLDKGEWVSVARSLRIARGVISSRRSLERVVAAVA
ncbi:hypothetical protein KI809_17330 [Geobacter pelophilus]|uniref:Uncharacterized protein n=1 Tax=Geoanaerobacter pelophilus TaxID=60036 RepID=A0AAW4L522_9BACT|nr:hypothetical protein [Geoanaerobacter pelophilus]MBT0666078.1 hypothetical protein [Geoanaerobacter pelophilus]